jgi:predicted RNase H-like HicB family nuclease
MMKYKVVVEKEEKGFSVYVPELPGCASQGETMREAMSNIKKAVKLYLWSIEQDRKSFNKRQVFIKNIAA